MRNYKKITINSDSILLLFWSIAIALIVYFRNHSGFDHNKWYVEIALIAFIQLSLQFIFMLKRSVKMYDFRLWFIVLSYLFMFGKQFLAAILSDTRFNGVVIFQRLYDVDTMYHASLYIILSIQAIFVGFFLTKEKSNYFTGVQDEPANNTLYITGLLLSVVSFACALITDITNIITIQASGRYADISGGIGLTDDFGLLFAPSILHLFFSGKLSKKKCFILLISISIYYVIVMALTGDRRYPIISIIVLCLAYMHIYNFRFKLKHFVYIVLSLIMLNFFVVLREIRQGNMVSLGVFISSYGLRLFDFSSTLFETLNEFGTSFYTVCLGFMGFPTLFSFRYGCTLLSGIMGIIPLGPLYYNSQIYRYGRVVDTVNSYYGTHPGGSIFEDMYTNFSYCAYIFLIVFGYCGYKLIFKDINDNRKKMIRYYILFYALIHLCRSSFTEVIRTAVWGLFIPLFIYKLVSVKSKSVNSRKQSRSDFSGSFRRSRDMKW